MSFWLLPLLLLLFLSLYWLVPPGNLLHEALHLPTLWRRLMRAPKDGMREKRWSYGDHPRQYVLSFLPEQSPLRPLTIVYFHGGGWRFGKPEHFRANAHVFTQQGYHVILPSYRRLPQFNGEDIREDLAAIWEMIREIRKKEGAQDYGLVIGGMSAGGHLTAMMTLDPDLRRAAGTSLQQLKGLFFLGAPLNLNEMPDSRTLRQLAGPKNTERFRKLNPWALITADLHCPALFVHGEKDGMVPPAAARSFAEKLEKTSRTKLEFHLLPHGSHLDVVEWAWREGKKRQLLLDWIRARENDSPADR